MWLGEAEDILEGERIPLRSASLSDAETPKGVATPARAQPLSEWRQVGGGPTRAISHIEGDLALERIWSRSIGSGSDSESRVIAEPIFANGVVYAMDASAEVSAVDAESGDLVWRADLTPRGEHGRDGFGGGLAVAGQRLVVANGFGEVLALDPSNGEELWRFRANSPFRSAPAVSNGIVVVVARDGELIGIDLETGGPRWRAGNFEGGAAMLGGAGPAISGEVVAAPFASGEISIFRLSDGERGWSEALGAPRRGSAIAQIADVSAAPVMSNGRIFAGSVSGRLVSFNIPNGRRIWSRDIGVYNRVWVAGGVSYLISEDARVYALDSNTGRSIWETQLPRFDDPEDLRDPFAYGGPILVGGHLFITSSEASLWRIDAATGEILEEADLPDGSSIPPIAANGVLYVLDEGGDLHAYR